MSFEEAGRQFAQLQAQYLAGQLPLAQFQQMVAQLRVLDSAGIWWQINPDSAQWMMWNGTQWVVPQPMPQPAYQPMQPVMQQPATSYSIPRPQMPQSTPAYGMPQATLTVRDKNAVPAIWEGLAPVIPGLAIGLVQGWPQYSANHALLAGFLIPSLLPTVLVPLVPKIGRTIAICLVLVCLIWLSWPVLTQLSAMVGNAKAVQAHAGRGLVGISLVYLIPRIWKMK
jgi:hypothetical protein